VFPVDMTGLNCSVYISCAYNASLQGVPGRHDRAQLQQRSRHSRPDWTRVFPVDMTGLNCSVRTILPGRHLITVFPVDMTGLNCSDCADAAFILQVPVLPVDMTGLNCSVTVFGHRAAVGVGCSRST